MHPKNKEKNNNNENEYEDDYSEGKYIYFF